MTEKTETWQMELSAFLKTPTIIASLDQPWDPLSTEVYHSHAFYQLDYFYKGFGTVYIGDRSYQVKPGDLLICNPNDSHKGRAASPHPMESIMFKFDLLGDAPRPTFPNYICNLGLMSRDQRMEMERYLRQACIEANKTDPESAQLAAALISVFFILLLRYFKDTAHLQNQGETDPIQAVLEYIKRHYRRQITLADLARMSGLHPKYLCHKFSTEVGISPIAALTQERISAARKLLANTSLPITEVGTRVGYQDVYHFSKRFKDVTGMSPRRFREENPR